MTFAFGGFVRVESTRRGDDGPHFAAVAAADKLPGLLGPEL